MPCMCVMRECGACDCCTCERARGQGARPHLTCKNPHSRPHKWPTKDTLGMSSCMATNMAHGYTFEGTFTRPKREREVPAARKLSCITRANSTPEKPTEAYWILPHVTPHTHMGHANGHKSRTHVTHMHNTHTGHAHDHKHAEGDHVQGGRGRADVSE